VVVCVVVGAVLVVVFVVVVVGAVLVVVFVVAVPVVDLEVCVVVVVFAVVEVVVFFVVALLLGFKVVSVSDVEDKGKGGPPVELVVTVGEVVPKVCVPALEVPNSCPVVAEACIEVVPIKCAPVVPIVVPAGIGGLKLLGEIPEEPDLTTRKERRTTTKTRIKFFIIILSQI